MDEERSIRPLNDALRDHIEQALSEAGLDRSVFVSRVDMSDESVDELRIGRRGAVRAGTGTLVVSCLVFG